jgi:prolipoprotein diacylglyceryltransferase
LLYGLSRFIYEFFRAGFSSTSSFGLPLPDGQIAAILMMAIGALWLVKTLGRRATSGEPESA